jgi:hypothetical protein
MVEWKLTGKHLIIQKACPNSTFCATNLTWAALGLRHEKPMNKPWAMTHPRPSVLVESLMKGTYICYRITPANSKTITHFATHIYPFLSFISITWLIVQSPAVSHPCSRLVTLMDGPLCPSEVYPPCTACRVCCNHHYVRRNRQTESGNLILIELCVSVILFFECVVFESRLPHACVLLHTLPMVMCNQFPAC